MIDEGESSQPSFSHSGKRLLFISSRRPGHTHAQVYEKNLQSGEERRLTFQNGATFSPHYDLADERVIYASTTDELKEYPPLLNPDGLPSRLPFPLNEPTEVYLHGVAGLEITRLTSRRGFDGQARFSTDGRSLTWTQAHETKNKRKTKVLSLNRTTGTLGQVHGLGVNPTQYVTSPKGNAAAWIRWDSDFTSTHLMLKRNSTAPTEVAGNFLVLKTDPVFSNNGAWLIWAQREVDSGDLTLWGFDMTTSCVHRWPMPQGGDRRHPTVSPDGKWLVYTLIQGERSRIARLPYSPPAGPCTPTP
ncbi:MAG: TolB family protein [Bdellovibrionales bacterium]